jgi:hypothetical protein
MHSRDVRFFKYFNPDASLAVLDTSTLKWTSPRLFNDPFEFPNAMDFSFKGEEIGGALMNELIRLAYGPDEPIGNPANQFILLTQMSRRNPRRGNVEEFRRFMEPATQETIKRFEQSQEDMRQFLRKFRNEFAVLCLSEKHDNLLMWSHYAKDHTGCVFQLRCLPDLDRPICAAQKVNYVPDYPLLASLEQYVKHLTGQSELDYDHLFEIFGFTKSLHWKYEAEWRCVSKLRDMNTGFDFAPLIPEELEAIYIGCRAIDEYKEKLLRLVQRNFPETRLFQSQVHIQNYGLYFEELH